MQELPPVRPELAERMRRPKVYIPNRGGHNYKLAEKYGDLVFVTAGTLDKFDLDKYKSAALLAMEDARQEDYLLISSLASICCVCTAILIHRFGRVNLLIFRRTGYVVRTVDLNKEPPNGGEYTPGTPV